MTTSIVVEQSTRDIARLMKMRVGAVWERRLDDLSPEERLDVLDMAEEMAQKNKQMEALGGNGHAGSSIGINGALELMRAVGLVVVGYHNAAAQEVSARARMQGLLSDDGLGKGMKDEG